MRKFLFDWLLIFVLIAAVITFMAQRVMAVGTHAGESISNQAYVNYKDANNNPMNIVYSNIVQTIVSQVAGIDNDPPTITEPGIQGTTITYPVVITNKGNGPDTFNLLTSNNCGWNVTVYNDLNSNSVLDPNEIYPQNEITDTGQLQADANFAVIVMVEIPEGTADTTQCDTTLTSESQFDPNISDQSILKTIAQDAVLEVIKAIDPSTDIKPGDIITYSITIRNTGSATAEDVVIIDRDPNNTTYKPGSIRNGPIGGNYNGTKQLTDDPNDDIAEYESSTKTITVNLGDLPPNDSWVIYFQVTINDGVTKGITIENTAEVDYKVAGKQQNTIIPNPATFNVSNLPGVQLDPDRQTLGNPGDVIVYPFNVNNLGNDADTIDLTYNSNIDPNLGWNYVFWKDVDGNGDPNTDGDFILTDTDGDLIVDTNSIPQDGNISVLLVITIPAGAPDQTTNTFVVTGASSIDPAVTDTVTFNTTVVAPVLTIVKEVSPSGSQPPGTELTYTIRVTNTGTGVATDVIITDTIPTYTTYKPGSIKTGSSLVTLQNCTDAFDTNDDAQFDSNSDAVIVGARETILLNPNSDFFVQLTVKID